MLTRNISQKETKRTKKSTITKRMQEETENLARIILSLPGFFYPVLFDIK